MSGVIKMGLTGAVAFVAAKHGTPFIAPYTASVLGKYNEEVVGAAIAGAVVVLAHKFV